MRKMNMDILKKVEEKRKALGLSKTEFIEKTGVFSEDGHQAEMKYSYYQIGMLEPDYETLKAICQTLDLDMETLIDEINRENDMKDTSRNMERYLTYLAQTKWDMEATLDTLTETHARERKIKLYFLQDIIHHLPQEEKKVFQEKYNAYKDSIHID